ncbi:stage IV sporulation protein FA [Salsuginibacillus halophilus]|uniref:Stage IV sporulation protein FA n=1 Tax=Salsuginibacillus halophilus TaxID=517424 RepID=A0A2P8HCS6_9BACI|nr:M23 family metallopeptidase [Salsuginibacillus halophilus]PSL43962.1 stage IV sporulation protein FA [Salsuginibacillus halophilus]
MDRRRAQIARKIRARQRDVDEKKREPLPYTYHPGPEEMQQHEPEFYAWQQAYKDEPKRKKQLQHRFLVQWLSALFLFLIIGMLFQADNPRLVPVQQAVESSFQDHFQFAAAASWYEENFGSPLPYMPEIAGSDETVEDPAAEVSYAAPAVGVIAEPFSEHGRGIRLETIESGTVEAAQGGVVIHAGASETWGEAVAVQHENGDESWYGMLENVDVGLYEHVSAGDVIGQAAVQEGTDKRQFSFGVKEDGEFIDPLDVMTFE